MLGAAATTVPVLSLRPFHWLVLVHSASAVLLLSRIGAAGGIARHVDPSAAAMEEGPLVRSHARRIAAAVSLLRAAYCYIPAVQAPPITLACSDYGCTLQTQEARKDRWTDWLLTSVGHHPPPDGESLEL